MKWRGSRICVWWHPWVSLWPKSQKQTYRVQKKLWIRTSGFNCVISNEKSKAPTKCKSFMWLVVHQHCLVTTDACGWTPNEGTFTLCPESPESCIHPFVHRRFTQSVLWNRVHAWTATDFPVPAAEHQASAEWWLQARKRAPQNLRRDFDTMAILVHWWVWKIFNGLHCSFIRKYVRYRRATVCNFEIWIFLCLFQLLHSVRSHAVLQLEFALYHCSLCWVSSRNLCFYRLNKDRSMAFRIVSCIC